MSVHDSTDTTGELGSLAMSCVNELVTQNCVPQEFGDFLLKLFEKSLLLLQQLTNAKLPLLDDRLALNISKTSYLFQVAEWRSGSVLGP